MKNFFRRPLGAFTVTGTVAIAALVTLSPQPASTQALTPTSSTDKAAVEKIVRDYILENPEIITQAIQILQSRKKLAEAAADRQMLDANRTALLNNPETPVGGNPQGDITVVEFFDYRCGVCKRIRPIIDQLVTSDRNIRRIYMEWPILGPNSVLASRAAIAARKQGKYLSLHNLMMKANSAYSEAAIMAMAKSVGIDTARLRQDMRSPETDAVLRKNYALANKLKLNGTPSFVIGDTLLRGGRDLESLRAIVAEARARKK